MSFLSVKFEYWLSFLIKGVSHISANGDVYQIENDKGSLSVLDVCGDIVLCALSLVDTPVSLQVGKLIGKSLTLQPVIKRDPIPLPDSSIKLRTLNLEAEIKDTVSEYFSVVYKS